MLLTTEAIRDLLGTIAIMAILAVAYGTIMRASMIAWFGRSLLGALFGGAAIMAMHDPIHVAEGVIGDPSKRVQFVPDKLKKVRVFRGIRDKWLELQDFTKWAGTGS